MDQQNTNQSETQLSASSPSSIPSTLDLSTLEPRRAIDNLLRYYVFGNQDVEKIVRGRHRAMGDAACLTVGSAENVEEAQYLIQESAGRYGKAKEMIEDLNFGLDRGFVRLRNLESELDMYLKAMVLLDQKIRAFWNSTEPKITEE